LLQAPRAPAGVTVLKSVGLSVEDVAAAAHFLARAEAAGIDPEQAARALGENIWSSR
jgi:ornithine cyclodeaminase/alanine dehydrogenase-like protein (mu-crystallin family)